MLTENYLSSRKEVIKQHAIAFFETIEMSGIQAEKREAGYNEIQFSS